MSEFCPICNTEMEEYHDSLDGWCLLEESETCPNNCYFYSYNAGAHHVFVLGKSFWWNYNTPKDEVAQTQEDIDKRLKGLKAKLYKLYYRVKRTKISQ